MLRSQLNKPLSIASNGTKLAKSTNTVTDKKGSVKSTSDKVNRAKTRRSRKSRPNSVCEPKLSVNIDTIELLVNSDKDGCFDIPNTTTAILTNKEDGEILSSYQNRVSIAGRFDAHSLQVRTKKNGQVLHIEGSPFAHRYGQNIYTSPNMNKAALICLRRACTKLKLKTKEEQRDIWRNGDIKLDRVDLAVNYKLESESAVNDVLRQVRRQLIEQPSTTRTNGTTVTMTPSDGKGFSISLYAKGPQMRRQRRFKNMPNADRLCKKCSSVLRIELRLRASELRKLGLDDPREWKDDTAEKVFMQYFHKKLDFLSVTSGVVTEEELADFPSRLRHVFGLHKSGVNLTTVYPKRTLQRHRSDFKKMGIDLRCPNQVEGTVIPLKEVLSPKAAIKSAPRWMIDAGLIPVKRSSK